VIVLPEMFTTGFTMAAIHHVSHRHRTASTPHADTYSSEAPR
jgi:predicted amidohydrolase